MSKIKQNKLLKLFVFTSIACVCFTLRAQDEFTKKVSKSYQLSQNSKLSVSNKYGNIDVRDWDKNEVKIDVEIIVHDINKDKADDALNSVEIEFSTNDNEIVVNTDYSDEFFNLVGKNYHSENKKFEVNYKIMLPPSLSVKIENKYGDLFVSKLNSTSYLDVAYGNLQANELIANAKEEMSEISLSYSKGNIEKCKWLKLNLKYSRLNIDDSKALIVISKYSKLFVQKGSSIVCESKYDTYEVGALANFVTNAQYSNFKFDAIVKKINLNTKYSDVRVLNIPLSFESIDIENSYGTINLGIADDASYRIDGYAKYAKIEYPGDSKVNEFEENNEFKVQGVVGKEAESLPNIKINTKYGGVKLIK
jgi:hypothetical protein